MIKDPIPSEIFRPRTAAALVAVVTASIATDGSSDYGPDSFRSDRPLGGTNEKRPRGEERTFLKMRSSI